MAISPKKLMEKIQSGEKDLVARLEQKIDSSLARNFDGKRGVIYYPFDAECEALRPFVLKRLLDKYRSQGWSSVKIRSRNDGIHYYDEGTKYFEFKYNTDENTRQNVDRYR